MPAGPHPLNDFIHFTEGKTRRARIISPRLKPGKVKMWRYTLNCIGLASRRDVHGKQGLFSPYGMRYGKKSAFNLSTQPGERFP